MAHDKETGRFNIELFADIFTNLDQLGLALPTRALLGLVPNFNPLQRHQCAGVHAFGSGAANGCGRGVGGVGAGRSCVVELVRISEGHCPPAAPPLKGGEQKGAANKKGRHLG